MAKLTYGLGEKNKLTMQQVLDASGVGQEYLDFKGRGLTVGGLNCGDFEKVFRVAQGTTELVVLAPQLEPVTVEVEFDNLPEVDRPLKTPENIKKGLFKKAVGAK